MSGGDPTLFKDIFTVDSVNAQKYDRAARISAKSANTNNNGQLTLQLDINNELFPVAKDDQLIIGLTPSLSVDGAKDDSKSWRDVSRGASSLADLYDYVCHGKVYRFEESDNAEQMKVFVSFGGLLMVLEGDARILTKLRIEYVYLLVRRG